jgi:hypothetical protein
MKALTKKPTIQKFEPVLRKVLIEAETEHRELQEVFGLMGWGDLPEELKIEIRDDIKAFKDELNGDYSTCDPYVLQRRKSVCYWVNMFRSGVCSLKTAVDSLKVRPL